LNTDQFNEIFAHLPSHGDRVLVAFYIPTHTEAKASELLSATDNGGARELVKFKNCQPLRVIRQGDGTTV
jgi:hypothetical protein